MAEALTIGKVVLKGVTVISDDRLMIESGSGVYLNGRFSEGLVNLSIGDHITDGQLEVQFIHVET